MIVIWNGLGCLVIPVVIVGAIAMGSIAEFDPGRKWPRMIAVLGTAFALLVSVFQKKQEARNPFYRVVELTDETEDPAVWGKNFPLQYDGYKRTTDMVRTRFGGSEAVPRTPSQADPRSIVAQSRLEEDTRLKIMWAGYAFATDFR